MTSIYEHVLMELENNNGTNIPTLYVPNTPIIIEYSDHGYPIENGRTARIFREGAMSPVMLIQQKKSHNKYLNIIRETQFGKIYHRFSMNFSPNFSTEPDNSMTVLEHKGRFLAYKNIETLYTFNDVHAEEELFQFSTLYDDDIDLFHTVNKLQHEIEALNLKKEYTIIGSVHSLDCLRSS